MAWIDTFFLKYRTVLANGVTVPQRSATNFIGATVLDDSGNDRTSVTVSGIPASVTWQPGGTDAVNVYASFTDACAACAGVGGPCVLWIDSSAGDPSIAAGVYEFGFATELRGMLPSSDSSSQVTLSWANGTSFQTAPIVIRDLILSGNTTAEALIVPDDGSRIDLYNCQFLSGNHTFPIFDVVDVASVIAVHDGCVTSGGHAVFRCSVEGSLSLYVYGDAVVGANTAKRVTMYIQSGDSAPSQTQTTLTPVFSGLDPTGVLSSGATGSRPSGSLVVGARYYDTTLGIPIWWNGSNWKNASGTTV